MFYPRAAASQATAAGSSRRTAKSIAVVDTIYEPEDKAIVHQVAEGQRRSRGGTG